MSDPNSRAVAYSLGLPPLVLVPRPEEHHVSAQGVATPPPAAATAASCVASREQQQQQQQQQQQEPQDSPLRGHRRYNWLRDLHRSEHSILQVAVDTRDGQHVAVKWVRPGNDVINRYMQSEALNHRKLQHPCVARFKEVIKSDGYVGIVMEYASGGSLFSHLQHALRFNETTARWFFQQLIIGLDYCHQKGVVNRDLRLNNMLVQVFPGEQRLPSLKIADFGYSKAHSAGHAKTKVGTLPYMAPEIFRSLGPYDGTKSDIWSCGVVLYTMLFGVHPFQPAGEDVKGRAPEAYWRAMLRLIMAGTWSIPEGAEVSEPCRDLLGRIFKDPEQRISIGEIYQHPWFTTDLPQEAEALKHGYAGNESYDGLQSEQEIRAILHQAMEEAEPHYV